MHTAPPPDAVSTFIAKWQQASPAERANYALFLTELCDVLGVPHPDAAANNPALDAYVFERGVTFVQRDGRKTNGRIDLYKRGCFVLEAKQYAEPKSAGDEFDLEFIVAEEPPAKKNLIARGTERWDDAMFKAFNQAERYAHHLPADEPNPPFLLVVDVGHVFELYADFSQKGKAYSAFPDARTHRVYLTDLLQPAKRELLRAGGSASVGAGLSAAAGSSRDGSRSKKEPKQRAKQPWPDTIPAQIKAVEQALAQADHPLTVPEIAKKFSRVKEPAVDEIVETLCALGRARPGDAEGTYVR